MTFNIKIIIFIAIGFLFLMFLLSLSGKKKTCADYNQDNVIELIKYDYLNNRHERWKKMANNKDTEKPNLTFELSKIQVTDTFLVPFSVRVNNKTNEYFAIFICKNENIEYSIK